MHFGFYFIWIRAFPLELQDKMKHFMDNLVSEYGDHETVNPQPGAGKSREIEVFKNESIHHESLQNIISDIWEQFLNDRNRKQ